ncbi:MAG TPA: glycosyltransferase family 2 protein [Candidatus Elarobacter sp.]|nr:glycosyltransferase family 2 protein [Candidatus Elarobacter sp.]
MTPYAIVCAGGGPRASAGLRARFPGVPLRYVGPASSAPFGVAADPSLALALRAVDAEVAIVVDPAVLLDLVSAAALVAAVEEDSLVAPVLVDDEGRVVNAGMLLVDDAARDRARVHMVGAGAMFASVAGALASDARASDVLAPDAFDGRCVAARTETLRALAPDVAEPDAWIAATAAARGERVRLALVPVAVRVTTADVQSGGDDPRRAPAERRLAAHATPPWYEFGAEAALGRSARTLRTPYGADMTVTDSAPRASVVVVGTPVDSAGFDRMLRANGLPLDDVVIANGRDALDRADRALRNRGDRYVAFVDARCVLFPGWLDALVDALERNALAAFSTFAPSGADARATVVAAARIPSCERLDAFETLHGSLADFVLRVARDRERGIVRVEGAQHMLPPPPDDVAFRLRYGCAPAEATIVPNAAAPRFRGIASIVMLSWNAAEFTKLAVESIRAVTRYPHEIIVVDNGSGEPTLSVLASLAVEHGVRIVYNGRNLGFGGGMNVGMAHARGDVVVILNNDVIVTEGWLEDMVGAMESRRTVGCTAPRSNHVASEQILAVPYADDVAMHRFAGARRRALRGRGYVAHRVVGFCLCIDRTVIDEIGGFDPRYGLGNFEDDDLAVRIRAAGWGIFVCDDVFIHHFGSVSFKANALDHRAHMARNWQAFCERWGLPNAPMATPYDARSLARPGFEHDAHFVPLPSPHDEAVTA